MAPAATSHDPLPSKCQLLCHLQATSVVIGSQSKTEMGWEARYWPVERSGEGEVSGVVGKVCGGTGAAKASVPPVGPPSRPRRRSPAHHLTREYGACVCILPGGAAQDLEGVGRGQVPAVGTRGPRRRRSSCSLTIMLAPSPGKMGVRRRHTRARGLRFSCSLTTSSTFSPGEGWAFAVGTRGPKGSASHAL